MSFNTLVTCGRCSKNIELFYTYHDSYFLNLCKNCYREIQKNKNDNFLLNRVEISKEHWFYRQ